MENNDYVHGYSDRERSRLRDQANTLADMLHHDTAYPAESRVLEAGCGIGAQTVLLAQNSPCARITSIDISPTSVEKAKALAGRSGVTNVTFQVADIFRLPFEDETFDHIFVCFVLEHLGEPVKALAVLKRVLKPGGTITVIEGDHGSCYFYPESAAARKAIQCLVDLQKDAGGNSLIGRELYPVLTSAGFREVRVSPRLVYVDNSRPALVEGFTKNTFTAMVEGVRAQALASGMTDAATFDKGITDLYRTTASDGVFCYTFFKGTAIK
ncbi:MAG TPA: class I SAM-dependent methyltransferase [Methanocella sp.]